MAYSSQMAAALSGATLSQLQHWRRHKPRGPVLVPEISQQPRALYSFRDLLALRTCVYLRQQTSLQRIRTAIGNLRDLGEQEHLSHYKLVGARDSVQLVTEEEAIDLVKKPGQRQVLVVMGDVLEAFPVRAGVVVPALFQPRERITVDPETKGGTPVISGTRVPYDSVADLMKDGVSAEEIATYYPSVAPEAARDAQDFALYIDSYDRQRTRVA